MKFPYISSRHILLKEEKEEVQTSDGVSALPTRWVAEFSGRSFSVQQNIFETPGPVIELSRAGETAEEAEDNLRQALIEQGWEFR